VWVRTHWFKSLNITSRYSRYSRCDTWRATGRLQPARPRSLAARAAALGGAPWLLSFSGMAGVLGWPPRAPLVAECDRGRVLASWAATCGGRRPRQRLIPFAAVRTMAPEDFVRALAEDLQARGRRSSGGAVPQAPARASLLTVWTCARGGRLPRRIVTPFATMRLMHCAGRAVACRQVRLAHRQVITDMQSPSTWLA